MTTNESSITTTAVQLRDALYSTWTASNGATVTLRNGRHTRTAVLYGSNRHDLWLFKAINAKGNRELVARVDLRQGVPEHLVDGWQVQA